MICDSEPPRRAAIAARVAEAGFEVGELVDNGPHALQILPFAKPSVIVMAQELVGMSALETLPLVRELEDAPEVVIFTNDDSMAESARDAGAIAVVDHLDYDRQDEVMRLLIEQFTTGNRRGIDRREIDDRRKVQDWNKVTIERRKGADRRGDGRRD